MELSCPELAVMAMQVTSGRGLPGTTLRALRMRRSSTCARGPNGPMSACRCSPRSASRRSWSSGTSSRPGELVPDFVGRLKAELEKRGVGHGCAALLHLPFRESQPPRGDRGNRGRVRALLQRGVRLRGAARAGEASRNCRELEGGGAAMGSIVARRVSEAENGVFHLARRFRGGRRGAGTEQVDGCRLGRRDTGGRLDGGSGGSRRMAARETAASRRAR